MKDKIDWHKEIISILKEKYKEISEDLSIPPPIFFNMQGLVIEYDKNNSSIKIKFPLKNEYANPFGKMQGGMIAAAIDNAFGPLSMLSSSMNFTRKLEIKYKKQIDTNREFIIVEAVVEEKTKRQLLMNAKVIDENGCVMATAKAIHWIV